MDTVAPHVRKIAILVTSLDAVAARQLLAHMPLELAQQVRKAVANLSNIETSEQDLVLADFRKQALASSQAVPSTSHRKKTASESRPAWQAGQSTAGVHASQTSATAATAEAVTYVHELTSSAHSRVGLANDSSARLSPMAADNATTKSNNSRRFDASGASTVDPESRFHRADIEAEKNPLRSWKWLDSEALAHLLRGERHGVIAVVLSQMKPEAAVALLTFLPMQEHSQILARLARLQEIDEEAMAAIDDHLARRLQDYQHQMTNASESLARIDALLSAAPLQLRKQWLDDITRHDKDLAGRLGIPSPAHEKRDTLVAAGTLSTNSHSAEQGSQFTGSSTSRAISPAEALTNHVVTTADMAPKSESSGAGPRILPFVQNNPSTPNDTSLASIEFEQILDLPPHQLASVLSTADAEVVLLALAGASPDFMKRFCNLLDRQDARDLQKRLRNIGPLNLRDIDEAQFEVAELAARISSSRGNYSISQQPALRVAA